MIHNPWTKEELELLFSNKKVLTRSEKSIRIKKINLGLAVPKFKVRNHNKKKWTKEEIELLKNNQIVPNRTKNSIKNKINRLGLVPKKLYRKPWKKKDEQLLKKLIKQKYTITDIFKMNIFSCSRMAIQKKACRLGLVENKKININNVLSKTNLIKFKKFLIQNYVGKTPNQLCEIWNQNNQEKVSRKKTVYHLSKLEIKVPYSEVIRMNIQKEKEEKIKKTHCKSTKLINQKIRESRVEIMKKRFAQGKDIWSGLPLSEQEKIDL